eukprot:gene5392-2432_t
MDLLFNPVLVSNMSVPSPSQSRARTVESLPRSSLPPACSNLPSTFNSAAPQPVSAVGTSLEKHSTFPVHLFGAPGQFVPADAVSGTQSQTLTPTAATPPIDSPLSPTSTAIAMPSNEAAALFQRWTQLVA